nr:hypothetical protein [Romeria gracilis]
MTETPLILIVDDDREIRDLLSQFLRSMAIGLRRSQTGRECGDR